MLTPIPDQCYGEIVKDFFDKKITYHTDLANYRCFGSRCVKKESSTDKKLREFENSIDNGRQEESGPLHKMHYISVNVENKEESPDFNPLSTSGKNRSADGSSEKSINPNNSASDATALQYEQCLNQGGAVQIEYRTIRMSESGKAEQDDLDNKQVQETTILDELDKITDNSDFFKRLEGHTKDLTTQARKDLDLFFPMNSLPRVEALIDRHKDYNGKYDFSQLSLEEFSSIFDDADLFGNEAVSLLSEDDFARLDPPKKNQSEEQSNFNLLCKKMLEDIDSGIKLGYLQGVFFRDHLRDLLNIDPSIPNSSLLSIVEKLDQCVENYKEKNQLKSLCELFREELGVKKIIEKIDDQIRQDKARDQESESDEEFLEKMNMLEHRIVTTITSIIYLSELPFAST